MSHAALYVEGIRAALDTRFPAIPDCVRVGDEPAGDFGIAHTFGVQPDGCGFQTYDLGYLPSYHTVAHELGHSMNAALFFAETGSNVGAWEDARCVREFWALRGFPLTIEEADVESTALWLQGNHFASWQRMATELFAEEFAAVVSGERALTYDFGVALDRQALLAFYMALGRGGADMGFKEDPDAQAYVADARNSFEAVKKVLAELSNRLSDIERMVRDYITSHP